MDKPSTAMISGIHAIIYSKHADRLLAFLRDVLQLPWVDAGNGRLFFAAPPTELGIHPDQEGHHELYLMCDDIQSTTSQLKKKGVELSVPITDRGWGLVTRLKLPSGDQIGLYEPKHLTAIGLSNPRQPKSTAGRKQARSTATNRRSGSKAVRHKKPNR